MIILGISCFYHDAAAALLVDDLLVAAVEEERFSRQKHDNRFPVHSIKFCLDLAGITTSDLDYVVFYEKPMTKFSRIVSTTLGAYPKSWPVFSEAMTGWLGDKLWIKDTLRHRLGISESRLLFVDHHISHAASAFFCSPFSESAILVADGVGEWTTTSIGQASASWDGTGGSSLILDSEIRFPHSLGILYSAFTAFLGFEVNEGEYKVMGMAPYGEPSQIDKVLKTITVGDDGSFRLNLDYFSFTHSLTETYSRKFVELFGDPRGQSDEFFTRSTHPDGDHPNWTESGAARNQRYADIAASIQRVTEDILIKMANEAAKRTGSKHLCMAGGVALNSVANGRILRETQFEDLYIQPAAGDSGGALGAALYASHILLGRPRRFVMEHAYWGQEYSESEIHEYLESQGLKYERFDDLDAQTDRLVEAMIDQKVVGLFQGRFEWGPRALGNRSIIADPRGAEMKDVVNRMIKYREPFRPFAPVILEEKTEEYFDFPDAARHSAARYMLLVAPYREGMGEKVNAVNHMGTGRLQTIRRSTNPRYYDLVKKFGNATGVPVLLNTSFNVRGEPVVSSPADASWTFHHSGIDLLVLENYVVTK
jgi:carbamoyltransferase